jgi:hypothetical protein
MAYRVCEVQKTPNPNAVKLVLDRVISDVPLSFRSAEAASGHGLARLLMGLKGVSAVLLLNDFVTINKSSEARWADITGRAKRILAKG